MNPLKLLKNLPHYASNRLVRPMSVTKLRFGYAYQLHPLQQVHCSATPLCDLYALQDADALESSSFGAYYYCHFSFFYFVIMNNCIF